MITDMIEKGAGKSFHYNNGMTCMQVFVSNRSFKLL